MKETEAKATLLAQILEGKVVHDEQRVAVCIKGIILGFPATLEAIGTSYPFGVSYFLETQLVGKESWTSQEPALKLTFIPRYIKGFLSIISRLLFFEARGQKLDEPDIDRTFICSYNLLDEAQRFANYPGVKDKLLQLERYSHFNELLVKTNAGLYLSQPTSFNALDLDVCRVTFQLLAELGQVVFDAFSVSH